MQENHQEKHKDQPAPHIVFVHRLLQNFIISIFLVALSLLCGMCGYHYIEGLTWIDAYLNASMILSGMGPVAELHTTAGKIFAGTYALYSGFAILIIASIMLAQIVNRFVHRFHLDLERKRKDLESR